MFKTLSKAWTISVLSLATLLALGADAIQAKQISEVSGASYLDRENIVTVSDTKYSSDKPRLHVATFAKGKLKYLPAKVYGWERKEDRSSDLEAICAVPDEPGYFYAAESGYYRGKGGRIFKIHIVPEDGEFTARIEGQFHPFPQSDKSYTTPDELQIEGMEALQHKKNGEIILLGLRGSDTCPGKLIWGRHRDGRFLIDGSAEVDLRCYFKGGRSISDLHLIRDGEKYRVLCSAATDIGDLGPFHSAIFCIGYFDPATLKFIEEAPKVLYDLCGLKVEAIGKTPEAISGSDLFIGTDDENMGGIIRPLPVR